jgi:hypothetical protein
MGEGEGGGGYPDFVPPHLNPLPRGERRYFGSYFPTKPLRVILGVMLEILQFRKLHTEPFRRNTVS